jgi:hypothetical protein
MVVKIITRTQEIFMSLEELTTQLSNLLIVSIEIFKIFAPLIDFFLIILRYIVIFDKNVKLYKISLRYLIYVILIYVLAYFC